jgi:hypothetical protein
MSGRLFALAALLVVGSVGAGFAGSSSATPQATCSVPGQIPCSAQPGDQTCDAYGAVCDPNQFLCVCAATTDLGSDLGPVDLAGSDFAPSADLSGTGGSAAGGGSVGGGMVSPPKSAGCSFVPGSR